MSYIKIPELDYFPLRDGGPDMLHTHDLRASSVERENCPACAQLENDFHWLRLNDALKGREAEFATREEFLAAYFAERHAEVAVA